MIPIETLHGNPCYRAGVMCVLYWDLMSHNTLVIISRILFVRVFERLELGKCCVLSQLFRVRK